jgi:hypothetical protein
MPFGRYRGLTLPQVLFTDPDYFFWIRGLLKGALAIEAERVARRACRVRIPREPAEAFVVDYFFEPGGNLFALVLCQKIKNAIYHRMRFTEQTVLISLVFEIESNMPNVNMCDS